MKNNLLKNAVLGLAALFVLSIVSCDSDDDLPVGPAIVVNTFCYGIDSASSFDVSSGFYNNVEEIRQGVFKTNAFITDENITATNNGDLDGAGPLIELSLYGNVDTVFQTGTYRIDNVEEVGNAAVSYLIDYDSNNAINRGIILLSGFVKVTPYQNGFFIDIDGEDSNGDRFHGAYFGVLTEL